MSETDPRQRSSLLLEYVGIGTRPSRKSLSSLGLIREPGGTWNQDFWLERIDFHTPSAIKKFFQNIPGLRRSITPARQISA